MNKKGFTFLELLLVVAILGIIGFIAASMFPQIATYFQRSPIREQAQFDARTCMDTIGQALSRGRANTVRISTPAGTPSVPYSRIDFILGTPLASGTTAYTFYLDNGTVKMREYNSLVPLPNGQTSPTPQKLSSNTSFLMFTGDSRDPAIMYVNLRIDAPLDTSGKNVLTTQTLSQEYHMAVNQ